MLQVIEATREFSAIERIKMENSKTLSLASEIKAGNTPEITGVTDIYISKAVNPQTNEEFEYAGLCYTDGIAIISGSTAVSTLSEIIESIRNEELTTEELKNLTFTGEYQVSANTGNRFFNLIIK